MVNFIPRHWKQILFLLIITPFLTELLTNNIPAPQFFKFKEFIILATLGYGPVLLLRELAARWRLGFTGYILLGIVYGIYNEGLLARTIFQAQLPNPSFNNYGTLWGINFSWAAIILIFHAFYAFLFPILIVYYFFPSSARKPWINKRVWLAVSAVFFIYISRIFLKNMHQVVTLLHYIFLVIAMISLVRMSGNFQDERMFELRRAKQWPFFLYGFVFVILLFTMSDFIIHKGVHPVVFILYILAICFGTIKLLHKKSLQTLLVFGLSAEIAFAAGSLLVAKINNSRPGMITSITFIGIFVLALILLIVVKKRDDFLSASAN